MTAHDARGVEIRPGYVVVYVTAGRYTERMTGVVRKVGPARVQLSWFDDGRGPMPGELTVNGTSCFVVDSLPYVEGRINTERPA